MSKAIHLEELWTNDINDGFNLTFPPHTIEVKDNINGARGLFLSKPLPAGTEVMSAPKVGGSITPLRATEEARELLLPLGNKRFHLEPSFILACAIYRRCKESQKGFDETLAPFLDITAEYSNSPMICTKTPELTRLVDDNDIVLRENAQETEELLSLLDVEQNPFRACMAYVQSRVWDGLGIIPGMDLMNSAYINDANTTFDSNENKLKYVLLKDVEAGEELLWSYNSSDALSTWLNYGYLDPMRPIRTNLLTRITQDELDKMEAFLVSVGDPKKALSFGSIDPLIKKQVLFYPGNEQSNSHSLVNNVVSHFNQIRGAFRCLSLIRAKRSLDTITQEDLGTNETRFGLDFERDVLTTIQQALSDGYDHTQERIKEFRQSKFGETVDITPYDDMVTEATEKWHHLLSIMQSACAAPDLDGFASILQQITGSAIDTKQSNIKALLTEMDAESPSVGLTLIRHHLIARKLI